MWRMLFVCVALPVVGLSLSASEPSKEVAKKAAKEVADASVAGDSEKVVDNMWPATVKEAGGRKAAIEGIELVMKTLKEKGFTIKKAEVQEPGDFVTDGDYMFVVVPTVTEMSIPGGTAIMKSYLLGLSSDGGKSWKFIDGSYLHVKEERDKLRPKLPAKMKLPEASKPEIVKDK